MITREELKQYQKTSVKDDVKQFLSAAEIIVIEVAKRGERKASFFIEAKHQKNNEYLQLINDELVLAGYTIGWLSEGKVTKSLTIIW